MVTITGSGFTNTDTIMLGNEALSNNVTFVSATQYEALLPVRSQGVYALNVRVDASGYATRSVNTDITYTLRVDNVFPRQASLMGGQKLTITGSGFHDDMTTVMVGESECEVDDISSTQVRYNDHFTISLERRM